MAQIKELPDNIINLIAAGEVIEHPASVVKELVENALDASATRISIETISGGKDLIRVVDNGSGIPRDELRLAIKRHATSKLQNVDQLWQIMTLGFRGEALASISEVAKVELASKTEEAQTGFALRVAGGKELSFAPIGIPQGTRVTVEELFYNTPARAKFLKAHSGENRRIIKAVGELALANPQVAFSLSVEGQLRLNTPGGKSSYLTAANSIYGPEFADKLVPVAYQSDLGSVYGWIGKFGHYASNRGNQTFAVNGRVFSHSSFAYVVESLYKGNLPARRFPVFLLDLRLSPASVDVNVHPTKREVKFQYEEQVKRLLHQAVSQALSSGDDRLVTEVEIKSVSRSSRTAPQAQYEEAVLLDSKVHDDIGETYLKQTETSGEDTSDPKDIQYLGQVYQTYLVWKYLGELVIMDQHAAHERILFEQIMQSLKKQGKVLEQELLFPQTLHLSPVEYDIVLGAQEFLNKFGYSVEEFGPNCLALRTIPLPINTGLPEAEATKAVLELATAAEEGYSQTEKSDLYWEAAQISACRGAIKAGDILNSTQAISLIRDWLELGVSTCPHGRPIIKRFNSDVLAKMFSRS